MSTLFGVCEHECTRAGHNLRPSHSTVLDVLHHQHVEGDAIHPALQNGRVWFTRLGQTFYILESATTAVASSGTSV